jgi:hypothetical protein
VGNCVLGAPDSTMATGSVELDLSGAAYCTRASRSLDGQNGDIELVSHVTWDNIEEGSISGTTSVYVAFAGCTMTGDYSLSKLGSDGAE